MQAENKNIIFTVFNKKLVYILAAFEIISAVIVALFFTVIREEYIVLSLPFVFFVFVLPIFMIGMRNRIIYRFTVDELQYRGIKPCAIKWEKIKSFQITDKSIELSLDNDNNVSLPIMSFNKNEMDKALSIYIK